MASLGEERGGEAPGAWWPLAPRSLDAVGGGRGLARMGEGHGGVGCRRGVDNIRLGELC